MNNSKRKYKEKILRKYIEIYPNDGLLLEVIERLEENGIPFASYVKALIVANEMTRWERLK